MIVQRSVVDRRARGILEQEIRGRLQEAGHYI
jgi:hypothetical protein